MTIEQIDSARDIYVEEKNKLCGRLIEVKRLILEPNQDHIRKRYKIERGNILKKINEIDTQIIKLKAAKRKIAQAESFTDSSVTIPSEPTQRDIIVKLVELRSEYEDFAADPSRISSRRQMASEFVVKLNAVIRTTINKKA